MGKYDPLGRHLAGQHGTEIELSLAGIESIIGGALPKAAARPAWWANERDSGSGRRQGRPWTHAGFNASLVPGTDRVRFLRHGYKVVSRGEGTAFFAKENPSEAEIAEANRAWENLIKLVARTAADASHRLGIEWDMDDPQVARDVIKATFEGLFYYTPSKKRRGSKSATPA